jgi:hypothetical protein
MKPTPTGDTDFREQARSFILADVFRISHHDVGENTKPSEVEVSYLTDDLCRMLERAYVKGFEEGISK